MTWFVYVDWEDNNDFTDSIDDITADVMDMSWQIGIRAPYADISEGGEIDITLDNSTQKYTPENTGSVLTGYILPQRRIKIVNDDGVTTRTMFVGWIEFPVIKWRKAGTATGAITATIKGQDAKLLLDNLDVALEQYTNTTADAVIAVVLQRGQIPPAIAGLWVLGQAGSSELGQTTVLGDASAYSTLDVGSTIFPTYGDQQPVTGWDVIKDVTSSERGRFFMDRDGKAIFWNRHHLLIKNNNDGTINTASLNKPQHMDYNYAAYLSNVVRVEAQPRTTSTSEVLWTLDRTQTIPINDVNQFDIRLRKDNGQFAGAGNLSGSASYSSGTATLKITPEGGKASITLTNNGSVPAVMTGLSVSGAPTTQQNQMTVEAIDSNSVGIYGKRGYNLNVSAIEDYNDIKSIANFELLRRKSPFGSFNKVKLLNADDGTANAFQLQRRIGDRINITASEVSHNADYFIIGERHSVGRGHVHETDFYLEQAAANSFWLLGEVGYSELGQTTILAY